MKMIAMPYEAFMELKASLLWLECLQTVVEENDNSEDIINETERLFNTREHTLSEEHPMELND